MISLRTSVVSLYLQKKRKRKKKTSRVCLFVCCFLFVYFQKKQTYQAFKLEITTRKNILHFLRTFSRNVRHVGHSFIKKKMVQQYINWCSSAKLVNKNFIFLKIRLHSCNKALYSEYIISV